MFKYLMLSLLLIAPLAHADHTEFHDSAVTPTGKAFLYEIQLSPTSKPVFAQLQENETYALKKPEGDTTLLIRAGHDGDKIMTSLASVDYIESYPGKGSSIKLPDRAWFTYVYARELQIGEEFPAPSDKFAGISVKLVGVSVDSAMPTN